MTARNILARLFLGTSLVLAAAASPALAGVRGNSYGGGYDCSNGTVVENADLAFNTNGSTLLVSFFGGFPSSFVGTFDETDFLLFSLWDADYGTGESVSGVSFFFGLFTTFSVSNPATGGTCSGFFVIENEPGADGRSLAATPPPTSLSEAWADARRSPATI